VGVIRPSFNCLIHFYKRISMSDNESMHSED